MATTISSGTQPYKKGSPSDFGTLYSGRALEFDGVVDYVSLDKININGTSGTTTISAWVRTDDAGVTQNIFANTYDGSNRVALQVKGDEAIIGHHTGSSKSGTILDNTWTHLVGTIDDGTYSLYINGEAQTGTTAISSASSTQVARIGSRADSSTELFNGDISNLQIWDKVWSLTDAQYAYTHPEKLITDNSSVTSGTTISNLKAWYPCTEGSPRSPQTTVYDGAGTDVTAKNHGTTTFVGLEQISHADDRTFSGTPNWSDAVGSRNRWTQDSGTYDEASTSGATEGTYFTDNYLKLAATSDGSDVRIAYLDGAHFEDADGASGAAMVSGRTYRLSYSIEITAYTSGTLSVGMANASYVIDTDSDKTYTATKSAATDSFDFVYDGTSDHAVIVIGASVSSAFTVYFDNFSIKEVGVATGWTTADAEPLIPQTALMGMSKPMVFDGVGDNVALGSTLALASSGGEMSVSCWFTTADITDATYRHIIGGTHPNLFAYLVTTGNTLRWNIDGAWNNATTTLVSGRLYHLVTTMNDTSYKLYVNGVLENTITDAASVSNMTEIGGGPNYSDHRGMINEVSAWNKELSLAEIQELFNDGVALDATTHSASPSTGTDNLIGYWRNDGASTWTDRSQNSNNGTPAGSLDTILLPEGTTSGKDILGFPLTHTNNGWLNLKGNTYTTGSDGTGSFVEVADNDVLDIESAITVEAWLRVDHIGNEMFALTKDTNQLYGIKITNSGVYQGILKTAGGLVAYTTTDTAVVGTWYHIVMTYDGANVKMYKDATLKTTTAETTNIVTSAVSLRIGCYSTSATGGAYAWEGQIDEVRIYNRTLSLAEITKNYNHGKSKHS